MSSATLPRLVAPFRWQLPVLALLVLVSLGLGHQTRRTGAPLEDFEDQPAGSFPAGWTSTSTRPVLPAAVSAPGADGSRQSLLLTPSSRNLHRGASVWSPLPDGTGAVQIEFSFAFRGGTSQAIRLWTTAGETDLTPTQLNLTIDNGRLRQFHPIVHEWQAVGGELQASIDPERPTWYRLRIVTAHDSNAVSFWLSAANDPTLPAEPAATLPAYRTNMALARLHLVVEQFQQDSFLRLDSIAVRSGDGVPAPAQTAANASDDYHRLWTGGPIPQARDELTSLPSVQHVQVHAPRDGTYTFLHGAAIAYHNGRFFANWANSPTHENSLEETLQGSVSTDGGLTWSPRQLIARDPSAQLNYSHAAYLRHQDHLWTFAARFRGWQPGPGVRFPDLQVEAFVLDDAANRWVSRGIVARDMWPYVEPLRLANGNWITAGQDSFAGPGVMISRGDDLTSWRTVKIPVSDDMPKGWGETALLPIAGGREILALVRPGGTRVAWASRSRDGGETWTTTQRTNYPIGISKMYTGRLSTQQPYLVANFHSRGDSDRDTLTIAVGRPGEDTLRMLYEIRYGPTRPVHPGFAKGSQWSYPYAYEHDGKLYVVYSINKEACGLSIIPLSALAAD